MTTNTLIGELRSEGGKGVVRVEDLYATDMEDLWSAITEPERLARWIAVVDGPVRLGAEFAASFTSGWSGTGVVEVCDAPHHLRVRTWQPGEPETVMEAWLTEEDGSTRLVIEERGLPLAEYADHGAGWQAHAEDLAAHVAGRQPGAWEQRWRELIADYRTLAGN